MNILLAMIPAFLWGTTYAVTQYTLPDWPPILLGAIRALPAGLLLLCLKPSLTSKPYWPVLAKVGVINIGIFFCLIFVMALTLPSAIAGVGMISTPVFAMIYHWVKNKQAPSVIQLICGILLITFAWLLFDPTGSSLSPIGLFAMLGAIMCLVVGSDITKSIGGKLHWWSVLTWQLIIGGSFLGVLSIVQAMFNPAPYQVALEQISIENILGLLWLILFATTIAYGLYVWLLQRMSVVDFTFGGIANPIAGVTMGVLLLGESYSYLQYLLMFGMLVMALMPQLMKLAVKNNQ